MHLEPAVIRRAAIARGQLDAGEHGIADIHEAMRGQVDDCRLRQRFAHPTLRGRRPGMCNRAADGPSDGPDLSQGRGKLARERGEGDERGPTRRSIADLRPIRAKHGQCHR
jgi:hypothetical protein